jgi:hypothetical protein
MVFKEIGRIYVLVPIIIVIIIIIIIMLLNLRSCYIWTAEGAELRDQIR